MAIVIRPTAYYYTLNTWIPLFYYFLYDFRPLPKVNVGGWGTVRVFPTTLYCQRVDKPPIGTPLIRIYPRYFESSLILNANIENGIIRLSTFICIMYWYVQNVLKTFTVWQRIWQFLLDWNQLLSILKTIMQLWNFLQNLW